MTDILKNAVEKRSAPQVFRRRKRRRFPEFRKNFLWCCIIILIALILGAIIGFYSNYFDEYFRTEEDKLAISEQDMTKKLKDFYLDKLLREREKSKR